MPINCASPLILFLLLLSNVIKLLADHFNVILTSEMSYNKVCCVNLPSGAQSLEEYVYVTILIAEAGVSIMISLLC